MKYSLHFVSTFLVCFLLFNGNLYSLKGLSKNIQQTERMARELNATNTKANKIDHSQWDNLLQKHVDENGLVDYKRFANDKLLLNNYLIMLSKNEPTENWSLEEVLAYYINLYNAATVKLIVENYPVKSIKDISRPWTKNRILIGNREISLDEIEHGILRKMDEPRIHFALNCASISCPKLLNQAFTASKINKQLDQAAEDFINGDKNHVSPSNPLLSPIFDWYKKDFKVNGKTDVIAFINQYSNIEIHPQAKISYLKYDWNLNEKGK
ncbi:DUF547 domain-containing protein [Aequorivita sp. H23M31]|uniref:DUF547 domain-containing protein n=1 Tax=Aequorivita ciconiae TaxID=2494375 RepID=A0A410G670_9FLAO|nr:DUF547 domain-containing protein [Aequorivita sp. H23M31]QAA82769.1 DUF547 domain-containing protein [Aequorivita sp. H23M31]